MVPMSPEREPWFPFRNANQQNNPLVLFFPFLTTTWFSSPNELGFQFDSFWNDSNITNASSSCSSSSLRNLNCRKKRSLNSLGLTRSVLPRQNNLELTSEAVEWQTLIGSHSDCWNGGFKRSHYPTCYFQNPKTTVWTSLFHSKARIWKKNCNIRLLESHFVLFWNCRTCWIKKKRHPPNLHCFEREVLLASWNGAQISL